MLKENPQARPNIYQTLKAACAMQGREVPIKDVWELTFDILYLLFALTRYLDLHRQVEIGRPASGCPSARTLGGCCRSCILAATTA